MSLARLGETALQLRSRRPHTSPNRTPRAVEDEIVALRKELAGTKIYVLAHDRHIRVITRDGELLRDLTLDPSRDYRPQPNP